MKKYCELFYYIYEDLFDKLGYKYIDKAYKNKYLIKKIKKFCYF